MVIPPEFVPDSGDIIWLSFDNKSGHEQSGRRPAVVLSAASYNKKSGLAVCCPVTSQIKGYPFEVIVKSVKVSGAVLSDQIRSLDWRARNSEYAGSVTENCLREIRLKIAALLQL